MTAATLLAGSLVASATVADSAMIFNLDRQTDGWATPGVH